MELPTEEELKKRVWAIHKLFTDKKLGHCYEEVAHQYGFKTYAAMRVAMKEQSNRENT